jgi:predicted transcriptional regulator
MKARKNRVGRRKINSEAASARLRLGTLARIDAVLEADERQADFLRDVIEAEIKRRERLKRARRKA